MFGFIKYAGSASFGLGLFMLVGSIFAPPLLLPGLIFSAVGIGLSVGGTLGDCLSQRIFDPSQSPSSTVVQSTPPSRPSRNTSEPRFVMDPKRGRVILYTERSAFASPITLNGSSAPRKPTDPFLITADDVSRLNKQASNKR